jgi:hypothetical protein
MIKAKRRRHIKDYKKAILRHVRDNKKKLAKTFVPRQDENFLDKALVDKNWVREEKAKLHYNYEIVHVFDCRPYNGKLKAYVYTTPDEFIIENVVVQTE